MLTSKSIGLDPVPIREALRGVRFALKRGGESLRASVPGQQDPSTAAKFARSVVDEMMDLGHFVNARASAIANSVIGSHPDLKAMLDDVVLSEDADAVFPATIYAAMKIALDRLQIKGVFVSEVAAQKAFKAEKAEGLGDSVPKFAARLAFRLHEFKLLKGQPIALNSRFNQDAILPVCIVGGLLWFQSNRHDDDQMDALHSAIDLALIKADDIGIVFKSGDQEALAVLFSKYAANV